MAHVLRAGECTPSDSPSSPIRQADWGCSWEYQMAERDSFYRRHTAGMWGGKTVAGSGSVWMCVCVCVCVCGTCTHLWKLPRIHKGPGEIRVMREAMRCLFLQCKLWEMLCEWRLSWIWLHWGGYLVELFTMKCNSASGNEAVFFFFFYCIHDQL